MSCNRTGGRWQRARLTFDNEVDAILDDHIIEITEVGSVVRGRFLSLATGNPPLPDELTEGTCRPDGIRPRITFKRLHAGGRITTEHTGKVIFTAGPPETVFIRGRFTRTTVNENRSVSTQTGDWETEKPT